MSTNTLSEDAADRISGTQETANETGASYLLFESSYWGKEAIGRWTEAVWAVIDFSTDDAYHIAYADSGNFGRWKTASEMSAVDGWVPKSKVDKMVSPEMVTRDAEGEAKGEVSIGPVKKSRYGDKAMLLGDTYDAFKGDEVADDINWEEAHHTYDGDTWVCDADSISTVARALSEAGYSVSVPKDY